MITLVPGEGFPCSLTCCRWGPLTRLLERRNPPHSSPRICSHGNNNNLSGTDHGRTQAAVRHSLWHLARKTTPTFCCLHLFYLSSSSFPGDHEFEGHLCGCLLCFACPGCDDGEVETFSSGGQGGASSPLGIDMNQLPLTTEFDDAVLSSPSSIGMMKREREKMHESFDLERERGACDLSSRGGGGSDDEDGGGASRKKLRLSKEQSALLEESFKHHSTLNPVRRTSPIPPLSALIAACYCCSILLMSRAVRTLFFLLLGSVSLLLLPSSSWTLLTRLYFLYVSPLCRSKRTHWPSN